MNKLEKTLVGGEAMFRKHSKIRIIGSKANVEKAEALLKKIEDLENIPESKARLIIQDLIDGHNLKAYILFDGNSVWSMNRIMGNLNRIVKAGTLYRGDKPRYYPVGSTLKIPAGGQPILSKYFYDFLHSCCGSIGHFNIYGWISQYPTLEALKQFFKKNEHGKRVIDYIPSWHTDAKRVVEAIEIKLFPLESYVRTNIVKRK